MESSLSLLQEPDATRRATLAAIAGHNQAKLARETLKRVTEQLTKQFVDQIEAAQKETAVARAEIEHLKAVKGEVFTLELCSLGAVFLCSAVFLEMTSPMTFFACIVLGSLATVGLIDVIARLVALTEGEAASKIKDETIGLCSLAALGFCLVLPNYSCTYCYLATRGCAGVVAGRITWRRVVGMANSWADRVGVR